MAIVAHPLVIPEMAAWERLSHTAQLRFCLAVMTIFGTDEDAITMLPDSEPTWAELRTAGLIATNPSHHLHLTPTGQHVVMELVDTYLFATMAATVC